MAAAGLRGASVQDVARTANLLPNAPSQHLAVASSALIASGVPSAALELRSVLQASEGPNPGA